MNHVTLRYDYFLIWGHGIQYRDHIINMIRSQADFKIVKILCHIPEKIEALINAVYSYDYAPISHLIGKTAYLKGTPKKVYFVFVENSLPDEDYFGEGQYRHIESKTIKYLKEQIRDNFNPKNNGKRSEAHVVHASDNQMQTDYILRYLGYEGINIFEDKQLGFEAPYHLREATEFFLKKIPVSSIYCNILAVGDTDSPACLTSIEDTPHFKALTGDTSTYEAYLNNHIGLALTDDHCLGTFLKTRETFSYLTPPFDTNYIIVRQISDGKYVVLDGVHRAAILSHQKATDIHVIEIINGEPND